MQVTTESFNNLDKCDIKYSTFNSAIYPSDNAVSLGYTESLSSFTPSNTSNVTSTDTTRYNTTDYNCIMLGYTEAQLIAQNDFSTELDTYTDSVSIPVGGFIINYKFINTNTAGTLNNLLNVTTNSVAIDPTIADPNQQLSPFRVLNKKEDNTTWWNSNDPAKGHTGDFNTTFSLQSLNNNLPTSFERIIETEPFSNLVNITLTLTGFGYPIDSTISLRCTVDGVPYNLVPVSETFQTGTGTGYVQGGVTYSTIISRADGTWNATVTFPAAPILPGPHTISVFSDSPAVHGSEIWYVDNNLYKRAVGTANTANSRYSNRDWDILTQVLHISETCMLSSLDLFFSTKDSNLPITICLREVDANIPSDPINTLATVTLPSSAVNIAGKDLNNNITAISATRFTFPRPILVESNKLYAIVIQSDSNNYKLVAAVNGDPNTLTGTTINGVYSYYKSLYKRTNNTQVEIENTTLKFVLYKAQFNTALTGQFDSTASVVTNSNAFIINCDYTLPENTNVEWRYSLDNWVTYKLTHPYFYTRLTSRYSGTIQFRIVMTTTNANFSPIIQYGSATISSISNLLTSYYVSNIFTGNTTYNNIKVVLQQYTPASTTQTLYWTDTLVHLSSEVVPSNVIADNVISSTNGAVIGKLWWYPMSLSTSTLLYNNIYSNTYQLLNLNNLYASNRLSYRIMIIQTSSTGVQLPLSTSIIIYPY